MLLIFCQCRYPKDKLYTQIVVGYGDTAAYFNSHHSLLLHPPMQMSILMYYGQ